MSESERMDHLPGYHTADLVLWRHPLSTIYYFTLEVFHLMRRFSEWVLKNIYYTFSLVVLAVSLAIAYQLDGPHQQWVRPVEKQLLWCAYWIGLGILSSVGLGTGLHTFVLYLGPHIAAVTLAAYECDSIQFPEPPYPDEILCPDAVSSRPAVNVTSSASDASDPSKTVITIWNIMSKVRLEAFMWGAGTALGELPPYFMARAARLSGQDEEQTDDEDDESVDSDSSDSDLLSKKKDSFAKRSRLWIKDFVTRVGFLGILACASIPNPLFDLAGITCGHFLIPFWTFFTATLIGKAVIKMHIQKLFVIIAFNEENVEAVISKTKEVPYVGHYLNDPLREFLNKQKASLHKGKVASSVTSDRQAWIPWLFEKLVTGMIVYFVLSIVNSLAQAHLKRLKQTVRRIRHNSGKTSSRASSLAALSRERGARPVTRSETKNGKTGMNGHVSSGLSDAGDSDTNGPVKRSNRSRRPRKAD